MTKSLLGAETYVNKINELVSAIPTADAIDQNKELADTAIKILLENNVDSNVVEAVQYFTTVAQQSFTAAHEAANQLNEFKQVAEDKYRMQADKTTQYFNMAHQIQKPKEEQSAEQKTMTAAELKQLFIKNGII